ncbi:glycosyltransferase family 4 protein [Aegicerativicinus sediminis]|uniref:glycosyltransferase family 4 protein n=1 Tax=Aegicerativicinus sediminis TaxID=2893202 RepID=UPI001E51ADD2|nr:glycosyltransferase family 4 protein [Aegicerativicinus sediminis]
MNIAIFSPNKDAYSETFIKAHIDHLKDDVYHYYGKNGKIKLANHQMVSKPVAFILRVWRKLRNKSYTELNNHKVYQSLTHHNIDVLLIEYGSHAFKLLPFLNKVKIPWVVHFHGYDAYVNSVIKDANNYAEVFKSATKIIAVSQDMMQKIISLGCPKDKMVYNPYGPNPRFSSVEANFKSQQLFALGRFTEKKAPQLTIQAFANVVAKYPNATLFMGGKGKLLKSCKDLVKKLEIEENVEFLGQLGPAEIEHYFANSIAFVQHSVTAENGDKEGTPVAILEASSAGLPIIATRHAGIKDTVIEGKTGLLCDERDITAMAKNIEQIIGNPEFAKETGREGRRFIQQNFSLEKHISTLQDILATACKTP